MRTGWDQRDILEIRSCALHRKMHQDQDGKVCRLRYCSARSVLEDRRLVECGLELSWIQQDSLAWTLVRDVCDAVLPSDEFFERLRPSWRCPTNAQFGSTTTPAHAKHCDGHLLQVTHVQTQRTVTDTGKALAEPPAVDHEGSW